MSWRSLAKKSEALRGLVRDLKRIRASLTFQRDRAIHRYLESHRVRKLQIGAGPTVIDGWLVTDLEPQSKQGTIYLDATQPLPFDDTCLDYVYSEHMIEHITFEQGRRMLAECFRVLRPGGSIRIATPDLRVLIELFAANPQPAQLKYIAWTTDKFIPDAGVYNPVFVLNNAVRAWGHQFLYDKPLLARALSEAGFDEIRDYRPNESGDPELRGIERHGLHHHSEEMNAFETFIMEARRP